MRLNWLMRLKPQPGMDGQAGISGALTGPAGKTAAPREVIEAVVVRAYREIIHSESQVFESEIRSPEAGHTHGVRRTAVQHAGHGRERGREEAARLDAEAFRKIDLTGNDPTTLKKAAIGIRGLFGGILKAGSGGIAPDRSFG